MQADAGTRLVALGVYSRLVQEHHFIRAESGKNGRDDIPGSDQAGVAMADATVSLSSIAVQPLVHEIELAAAIVDLGVTVTSGPPIFDDRH